MENFRPEQRHVESIDISNQYQSMGMIDFMRFLRQQIKDDPQKTFTLILDWKDVTTARKAKALLDDRRWHITSCTVRATQMQHDQDINAFASGVLWQKID